MEGSELIKWFANNVDATISVVKPIACAIIGAIFYRGQIEKKEFEKIKAGQFEKITEELLTDGKMTYSELYNMTNFLNIAKKADEEFKKLPNSKVHYENGRNFDWYMRFYDAVGTVSDEEMQTLWAKVLAGEINEPGTFSLRSIDCLRNLRKEDALLFSRAYQACIILKGSIFIPRYDEYLSEYSFSLNDILKLDELGLLRCDALLSITYESINDSPIEIESQNYVVIIEEIKSFDKKLYVFAYPMTTIGKEMSLLLNRNDVTDRENFINLCRVLRRKNNCKVSLFNMNGIVGQKVDFDKKDIPSNEE